MGKSSGGPSSSTVYQSSLPEYAEPYYTRMMDRAESESLRDYTPYEGQRLAETAPETWMARDMVMGMQGIPGLGEAYDTTQSALGVAQQWAGYQPGQYDPFTGMSQYGYNDPSQWGGPQTASDYVGGLADFQGPEANRFLYGDAERFTPDAANYYMSPYMQNVVDREKDQAMTDFQRAQAGRDAQAVAAGAFGGTREGVVQGLAYEDLMDTMGDIQARGLQQSYEQAARQFGEDRAALMQREAERASENARVDEFGRLISGQEADVRLGAYDLAGRLFGADRETQMAIDQARAEELARYEQMGQAESQYTGDLQMQYDRLMSDILGGSSQLIGQYGQDLFGYGTAERDALLQDAQLREQIGADIEQEQQQLLDLGYEDYLRQLAYPRDQLNLYSNLLQGIPVQPDRTQELYMARNPLQDAIGTGISALGLYQGLK